MPAPPRFQTRWRLNLAGSGCAVAVAQLQDGTVVLRATVWENPYPASDERSLVWKIDVAEIENHLRRLAEQFPESARPDDGYGPAFYYDPHFFERSAQVLEGWRISKPKGSRRKIDAAVAAAIAVREAVSVGDATSDPTVVVV